MSRNSALIRRLAPLHLAVFLTGFGLWVPIEKLFMNEIGFQPATIGLMVAAYAAVVPIIEIPSGVLADRWSRRGMLIIGTVAALISVLLAGLSSTVPTYILSVMVLGIYFATASGTLDSMVYDTVLEVTGDGQGFQRQIGRIRLIESVALVGSGLAGGWIAELTSTRMTYFLTLPILALSIIALLRFEEPRQHQVEQRTSLRAHLRLTATTLLRSGTLRPIVLLSLLSSVLLTTLYEFGPLWLVALSAATMIFGPAWAGLMASIGIGGLLAGRLRLDRPLVLAAAAIISVLSVIGLIMSRNVLIAILSQIALVLVIMVISIHVTSLLHDAVPSTIRAGVASGVSSLSWMAFLPFSLSFGLLHQATDVFTAGWMIAAAVVLTFAVLVKLTAGPAAPPEPAALLQESSVGGR
ncbi:MFS transporter [Microlunatus speluncae]|uniref:MFS transporter n=1 Tax=Microlunatus speluncae TaxID=2594267 RepID=UPI0012668498|nr:MFS transporter [Microlunatus speluncae]